MKRCTFLVYGVFHLEELGDEESGPLGLEKVWDAHFESEGEARDWVNAQAKPHWFHVEEVVGAVSP